MNFFILKNTKHSNSCKSHKNNYNVITIVNVSFWFWFWHLILALWTCVTYRKVENQRGRARKKPKDDYDETKLSLSLNGSSWVNLAAPGHFQQNGQVVAFFIAGQKLKWCKTILFYVPLRKESFFSRAFRSHPAHSLGYANGTTNSS